ncbi:PIN domain-containing protein [Chroococcidiopsis sp. CCALA 051]|uniref:type II toxin-antitoxin system VapC family toxin n=1 Tax=Chroococcidiopsis sp. CCALA 051 TaxID=869949 RepID=UPI000D0DFA4C|nr:PIN domain-containing protein [Chroococcidiopsis sp. CCALA 051]MBE9018459.1 type II toxin-antitoxin system VapC family toxin [Chroococcidiopsidales cyanobacterium LEGE 13417]PSM45488.1 PIN domain-containing protein [Chroococcidiopsis sp. CCALA 051]
MNKVFVDTAAWIAILNSKDALHQPAKEIQADLRRQNTYLVTTEFVFLEVADAFCVSSTRNQATSFIDGLHLLPILQIIPISQALYNEGWNLYKQRPDKNWSLTDCISFIVMMQEGIIKAFTSDRHFEQAGFIKLL